MQFKSGNILIFKGTEWHRFILKLHKKDTWRYYLPRAFIQIGTLSRYVHTATIIQEGNRWYIVQALFLDGIVKQRLDMTWLENQILANKIDMFEDSSFNQDDFNKQLNKVLGHKYSILGIVNIAIYNLFGIDLIGDYLQESEERFCSWLTCECHKKKVNKNYWLISPADLAHSDNYIYKVI